MVSIRHTTLCAAYPSPVLFHYSSAAGLEHPKNMKTGLVSPACARLYSWLWQRWCCAGRKDSDRLQAEEDQEGDVVMKMVPPSTTDLHTPA